MFSKNYFDNSSKQTTYCTLRDTNMQVLALQLKNLERCHIIYRLTSGEPFK